MNTWYYIKNWFKKSKKPQDIVKPSIAIRKKRDNNSLTDSEIALIRKLYALRKEYNVKTYDQFTDFCNKELGINKSRSVYHRIVNKEGGYSVEKNEK